MPLGSQLSKSLNALEGQVFKVPKEELSNSWHSSFERSDSEDSGRGSDVEEELNEDSKNLSKSWHGSFERSDSEGSDRSLDVEEKPNEDSKNLSKSWHSSSEKSDSEGSDRGSDVEEEPNEDSFEFVSLSNLDIEVSDLKEMQIAGFSKQKLLEMCNFCKISYGNNDDKLIGNYKTKAELIEQGYHIIPFYYSKSKKMAGFIFAKGSEITIAYRGTQNFDDIIADASAASTSGFLHEDEGMMHSGFYKAFEDSWPSLDKALINYAEQQKSEIEVFKFNCVGHSMGGALANIAALYLKKIKGVEHVCVATFGSPRVFNFRGAEVYKEFLEKDTIRVVSLSDPVPMFPNGFMDFKHVGKPFKIKTSNFVTYYLGMNFYIVGGHYHKTDTYYSCIQDIKPEDFQPDDSVSRYYYFSCAAAVPYNIITTALTTPYYYLIAGTNENIEQHCLEIAVKSSSGQSIADNGHTLDNALASSRNPLIISYIGCNVNRRDLGLNPLPFTHYDYINRGNVVPRQLKGIKNAPDRNLRIATSGANQGIAKIFKDSKDSNGSSFKLTADNIREISQMLLNNGISETKLPFPDGCIYIFDWNEISRASSTSLEKMVESFTSLSKALKGVSNGRTVNAGNQNLRTKSTNSKQQKLASNGENSIIDKKVPAQKSLGNNSNMEGVMGKNKKSGLNSKDSRTKQSTSGKGAPIEDKKRTKKSEIHNKQLLVEPNADVSNKQLIDQEVHKFVDGVVKTSNKTPVGQPEDSSSGTGAGNDNGTNTCVDPNVTIPKILDFVPFVKDKQTIHDREDSGCGSGSSTPGPEAPAAVSDDHFTEDVPTQPTRPSGGSTQEIPEEVSVLNVTHTPEASDEKQIINDYNKEGFTPLHVAALKGDVNKGKHLIGLGANIEDTSKSRHSEGNTALHLAAQEGHKGFVKLLLERGANANSVSSTRSGVAPLHQAAYNGHVDVVKLLIERGARIDAGDRHNDTPLKYASAQGNSEVVLYLLQKGADLYLQNKDGETALHSAAEHGHPGVASILIDAAEDKEKYVNVQSHCVGTALHVIAYNREINEGHKKVIKLLLSNGASPYLENNPITNALLQNDFIKKHSLSMAITRKNTEFIEFMTSLGYSDPPQVIPTEASAPISGGNAPGAAEPDKTSKNAQKSKLPTIAAFTLTAAAVVSVALSVYFEMLAVGIAVGFCCLAVAAVIYCCSPKSSVERNNVTHVADTKTVS